LVKKRLFVREKGGRFIAVTFSVKGEAQQARNQILSVSKKGGDKTANLSIHSGGSESVKQKGSISLIQEGFCANGGKSQKKGEGADFVWFQEEGGKIGVKIASAKSGAFYGRQRNCTMGTSAARKGKKV